MADFDLKKKTFWRYFLPVWFSVSRGNLRDVNRHRGGYTDRKQRYTSWEWQINFVPLFWWIFLFWIGWIVVGYLKFLS